LTSQAECPRTITIVRIGASIAALWGWPKSYRGSVFGGRHFNGISTTKIGQRPQDILTSIGVIKGGSIA